MKKIITFFSMLISASPLFSNTSDFYGKHWNCTLAFISNFSINDATDLTKRKLEPNAIMFPLNGACLLYINNKTKTKQLRQIVH